VVHLFYLVQRKGMPLPAAHLLPLADTAVYDSQLAFNRLKGDCFI
jgi:hypothetical protein